MKERPIIFNATLVPPTLDGRKTQTRRIMKTQPGQITAAGRPLFFEHGDTGRRIKPVCPHGQTGDRLWVRETFTLTQFNKPVYCADCRDADGYFWSEAAADRSAVKWKPSIHMPRHQSRITLEIVSVRIERLQDISEADAIAEGCHPDKHLRGDDDIAVDEAMRWLERRANRLRNDYPIARFMVLWDEIYGPGSWDANPWVWVIEFKRIAA